MNEGLRWLPSNVFGRGRAPQLTRAVHMIEATQLVQSLFDLGRRHPKVIGKFLLIQYRNRFALPVTPAV